MKLQIEPVLNAVFLAGLMAFGWPDATNGSDTHTGTKKAACCPVDALEAGPISDSSLYQLESKWRTDTGREIKLGELAGRPQVVTMFFSTCTFACPILLHDMRKIEAALPPEFREKVGFVMITFDSEKDTPEVLAEYRSNAKIPENWTLLTANTDDVLELAVLLGVKYKKDAQGQFAHSNVITILNSKGEIALQQTGLNRDPVDAVALLEKLP